MHNELRQQIHDNLIGKSTDTLLEIWQNGDPEEWDDVTFEVVGEILGERLGDMPPRSVKLEVRGLLKQVEEHLDAHEWDQAIKLCQQILKVDSQAALAHHYRGIAWDELGQLESARVSFRAALELDPKLKAARERLGYVEQDLAAEIPEPAISQDLIEAMRLLDLGKPDQALKLAESAAPGMQDLAINHYYLGVIYDESNQMERSLASLQKAVQLDPGLKDAWELLECVEDELGEEFEDSETRQHLERACEYVDAGETEKALKECDLAKKALPDIATAWNYLGMIYRGAGQLDLAIEAYRKAIQLNPRFYPARTNLADARVLQEEEQYRLIAKGSEIAEGDQINPDIDSATVPEYEGNDGLAPQWLYMSEPAYLLRGWPGHRNRQGRIGLDPLDTDFEQAHIEGTIIRRLFTFKLRTRNPVYLALMILAGLFYSLPFVFMNPLTTMMLIQGEIRFYLDLFIYSPFYFVGIALLLNVFLSIVFKKSADALDDGSSFY